MERAPQKDVPLTWESPPSRLPGLGPGAAESLRAFGIRTVGDLLWSLPAGYDDLRAPLSVDEAVARASELGEARVAVIGTVETTSVIPMRGRRALRLVLKGADTKLHAWWFFLAHGVLKSAKAGTPALLVGRVRIEDKKPPRMIHPDFLSGQAPAVRVRYPRYGVAGALLRKGIEVALGALEELPDPVPHEISVREGMPSAPPLLRAVHGATDAPPAASVIARVRERIAWAEVFTRTFDRLRLEAVSDGVLPGIALEGRVSMSELEHAFAFSFTDSQRAAVAEIASTLTVAKPTRRLLLGDVGTGKTAVALAAVTQAVRSGAQAALLAPTTVLAKQYVDAMAPIVNGFGVRAALLTSGTIAAEKRRILAGLASGTIDAVVGTHALLSQDVQFARLGLVVVDEQHRLGVAQRLALVQKRPPAPVEVDPQQTLGGAPGETKRVKRKVSVSGPPKTKQSGRGASSSAAGSTTDSSGNSRRGHGRPEEEGGGSRPHLLTLSATPIPRTLALALRGDLPVTTLAERPRGRKPVATELLARSHARSIIERIREVVSRGEQVFVVCPLIDVNEDEDDESPLASAVARAEEISAVLGREAVTLVHGALGHVRKTEAMRAFRKGEARVLVGTTVVEVGVDVPNATLMVVESAERFGMAQLHQLRGRVGRGAVAGTCILVHDDEVGDSARARLDALVRLDRGEDVARADLELRGAGDLWGTKQSGDEEGLTYLEPWESPAWLQRIPADAARILAHDPKLEHIEHRALRGAVERFRTALAVREEAG